MSLPITLIVPKSPRKDRVESEGVKVLRYMGRNVSVYIQGDEGMGMRALRA